MIKYLKHKINGLILWLHGNKSFKATIIAAIDSKNFGIGFEGQLCWNVKVDMHFFKKTTKMKKVFGGNNVIVCGSTTFESLGFKNLPDRHMIVITRRPKIYIHTKYLKINTVETCILENINSEQIIVIKDTKDIYTIFVDSPESVYCALRIIQDKTNKQSKVFIAGGRQIYDIFLDKNIPGITVDDCCITYIDNTSETFKPTFNGRFDTYFPITKLIVNFKVKAVKNISKGVDIKYFKRIKL